MTLRKRDYEPPEGYFTRINGTALQLGIPVQGENRFLYETGRQDLIANIQRSRDRLSQALGSAQATGQTLHEALCAYQAHLQREYHQLSKLPAKTVTATIECSGNSRRLLTPKQKGIQWELGAVGNAEWLGVPLSNLLEQAGLMPGAVEVILEGADKGEIKEEPKSPGEIHFARSLGVKDAQEVLLAYRMNGKQLPASHGFPVRAVVPGWYGMASVKWLRSIFVTDRPFQGFFQTFDYTYFERLRGLPTLKPVADMQVKAIITRPRAGETVSSEKPLLVHGVTWAGQSQVKSVHVSVDGGQNWSEAKVQAQAGPYTWQSWKYEWDKPKRGEHVLLAKATDEQGRVQPLRRDQDRRGYMINHVLPVRVKVG